MNEETWQDSPINADAVKDWTITPEGYLRFDVPLARPGVLIYDQKRGDAFTAREYRSESELFNQDSVNSLIGKPVTMPPHPKGVDARNYKALAVGIVTDAKKSGVDLMATIEIRDEKSIRRIQQDKRLRGASAAYHVKNKIRREGVAQEDGQRFDTVDEGLFYNHVIIARNPRVKTARFNLDGETMDLDEALETITTLKNENGKLTSDLNNTRGELLKANNKLLNMDSANGEAYLQGVADGKRENALMDTAKTMGINVDGLDDIKLIKQAIVKKANPNMNMDSLNDDNIDVAVDMAIASNGAKKFEQKPRRLNTDSEPEEGKAKNHFRTYQERLMCGHQKPKGGE